MLIEPFAFQNSKQDEAVKLVLKNKSSRSFQQSFSAETVPYIVHGLLSQWCLDRNGAMIRS